MRHHAKHGLLLVENTGDVAGRAVGVGRHRWLAVRLDVTEGDAVFIFQPLQGIGVGVVVAFVMGDGDPHDLPQVIATGEIAVGVVDAQIDVPAYEADAGIGEQGAGQQAGFDCNLETVADRQDAGACLGTSDDLAHDRRMRGDRPATQIVAVGKSTRQHDQVRFRQFTVAVPDHDGVTPHALRQRNLNVAVAVGTGEYDDCGLHGLTSP